MQRRSFLQVSWILVFGLFWLPQTGSAQAVSWDFPDQPESEWVSSLPGEPSTAFCAEWNPEFGYLGGRCCRTPRLQLRDKSKDRCAPERRRASFCEEATVEQQLYAEDAEAGRLGDLLAYLEHQRGYNGKQSYCSVNTGFLVHGRKIVTTETNHLVQKNPARCVDYGTDDLVTMLEWLGREVGKSFTTPETRQAKLVLGDASAPRGGCLTGRGGRRGHKSHTSGLDVDVGFLTVFPNKPVVTQFHKTFGWEANWWLIKKMFYNPYVCVKIMFLDRMWINKLAKHVSNDPSWPLLRKYIVSKPGHKNHIHVRIGEHQGPPGCAEVYNPDEDEGDDGEEIGGLPGSDDSPQPADSLESSDGEESAEADLTPRERRRPASGHTVSVPPAQKKQAQR